ncbi:uncharacterized protein LOC133325711, partial [Musca vetustissima]|uniref:uncharacterized protein LOC133325711 n=1 Tax=Musca vetustissima TaxID=27455 RepID=UPI002AB732A3
KFFIVFAVVAAAAATHISNEYLPPTVVDGAVETYAVETGVAPVENYQVEEAAPAHTFSDAEGYRYKTLRRRVVRRQRRDVSNEYLPPVEVSEAVPEVVNTEPTEIVEVAPAHSFSEADGYRYKTHRRRVIRRQRRDVSNEYLPPVEVSEVAPEVAYNEPIETVETVEVAPAHSFSEADGYRYKTLRRRVVRRQRRDVSNEYLPPVEVSEAVPEVAYNEPTETVETVEVAPAHSFSEADGYRYKTHRRRVVRRQRRDVANEYLPPVASANVAEFVNTYTAPVVAVETQEVESAVPAHTFTDVDGYRYKTQRRRVIRRN